MRRGKRLVEPLFEVDFGECVQSEGYYKIGQRPFVFSSVFEPCQNEHGYHRSPYLYLHGIARCADEAFDSRQLLEIAEKHFDEPPRLIEGGRLWMPQV